MYCNECGNKLNSNEKFCKNCENKIHAINRENKKSSILSKISLGLMIPSSLILIIIFFIYFPKMFIMDIDEVDYYTISFYGNLAALILSIISQKKHRDKLSKNIIIFLIVLYGIISSIIGFFWIFAIISFIIAFW